MDGKCLCATWATLGGIYMRLMIIAASLLATCAAAPAMAWSEVSHMTTGAIAFDDLTASNPALLAKLEPIIAAHPHYAKIAARAGNLKGAARMRVIFQWLARWPDDARATEFDRPTWHYELRVVYGRTWLWPFRNGEARKAFDLNFRTLSNAKAAPRDRAIALSWLMHIVGDIQQPLHAGHQMTAAFAKTDEAGQLAFIRTEKGGKPVGLHEYWDSSLDVAGPVDATANRWSSLLPALYPRAKIRLRTYARTPKQQFSLWLDESLQLSKRIGYTGTALKATPNKADAPVATAFEIGIVQEISKRRVATGGYRIADTIKMAMK